MSKEDVIDYLQEKLYGSPLALKEVIFEGIYRIRCGIDHNKILNWYNRIEEIFYETNSHNKL